MEVPKKCTSLSKKCIWKKHLEKKAYWAAVKAFSLPKSIFTGKSKILRDKQVIKF